MRRPSGSMVLSFGCALVLVGTARAQFGRGGGDWVTSGGDAQRSSWVRTDPKISRDSLQKPGFQFLWKVKFPNETRLTPAITLDRYIGYRGFRSLGYVGATSDAIYALDTDLGKIEWQKRFPITSHAAAAGPCPGGMTANLARPAVAALPAAPGGRGFGGGAGRGGARSGVGQPGEGAVTLAQVASSNPGAGRGPAPGPPAATPGTPGAPAAPGGRGRGGAGGGGGGFGRTINYLHALSSDGMFHSMYVSNGEEPEPPVKFLPPNAMAGGLIVVDGVAYAVTSNGCGGAPNGLWALDLATKQVATWNASSSAVGGSAGPAIAPDGTFYVTSGAEITALAPKTLQVKETYRADAEFVSSPVIFEFKEKILLAAAAKDGRIHLFDTASLKAPLQKSAPLTTSASFAPGALASWQDSGGARWILVPVSGALSADAKFPSTNGAVTNGAVAAWKLVEENGSLAFQPGWVSHDIASPVPPIIVNGVVFAASSGNQRSARSMIYALDGSTGKELWTSGNTITSYVAPGGGLSAVGSQVYLGTYDGTLYAFGFPIEH